MFKGDKNTSKGRQLKALTMASMLALSPLSFAEDSIGAVGEDPSALAMTTDLLVVRPVLLATTIVGSALWVVSLPFSAGGGNIKQAADTLVIGPGEATFVRCLGCTASGYTKSQ